MKKITLQSRFLIRQEPILLALAAVGVGLAAGGGIWLFKALIEGLHHLFFVEMNQRLDILFPFAVIFLPAVGGLMVGGIMHWLVGEERHQGVAGIIEAVALAGGRLRYKRIPLKILAAALSIGSGASVGPEDPSVQLGANIGSMVGQKFNLSEERIRTLVAAGAAAGIAAAFNAPIAGIFFALEIIIGEIGHSALGIIVVASVSSSILTQYIAGNQPAFQVPPFGFHKIAELPFYFLLGVLAGPVSALYVRLLGSMKELFLRIALPRWVKPSLAGFAVGIIGFFLPQVFGIGYETIEHVLNNQLNSFYLLLLLLVAKLILTPLSIGGGFAGGVFAPSLFIGAMLGGALGSVVQSVFPTLNAVPATYAMVGMAAVLAGSVHAPLTAILLLFEMTNDYHIILPLMFAVAVSLVISRTLSPDSVYNSELARKGIRLERGRIVDVLESIRVVEVMQTNPPTIEARKSVEEAIPLLLQKNTNYALVMAEGNRLIGIITREDIRKIDPQRWKEITVSEACSKKVLFAYHDEKIGDALRRMSLQDVGQLPVVDRDDPNRVLGVLRRADILQAYDAALTRRALYKDQITENQLDALTEENVKVFELSLQPGNPNIGKRIMDIPLPQRTLIVRVRRGKKFWIPKGDTILKEGDRILVICDVENQEQIRNALGGNN